MPNTAQLFVAFALTLAGALAAASIALRAGARAVERSITEIDL